MDKLVVRETTWRMKEIFLVTGDSQKRVSRKIKQIGPTLERPYIPKESPYPAEDPKHRERSEVGYWRKFTEAFKRYYR